MAEGDDGDKTEAATPRRREEAHGAGQVAKSQDLTSAALLMAGLLTLSFTGQSIMDALKRIMMSLLGNQYWGDPREMIDNSLRMTIPQMVRALAPVMGIVAMVAIVVTGIQVGFRVNFERLTPSFAKLNPVGGIGRLFGGQNWMQLAMNVLKMTIVGSIAWHEINSDVETMLSLGQMPFPANFLAGVKIIYDLAFQMAMALLLIATADYVWQRYKFEKDIRMSKQDIKDESKMMEGDMQMKNRRRQMARKMVMQRMHTDVPKADVVVTNPTELAIALKYDPDGMGAPRVVAKGAGFLAARIRQIALQSGVPLVERKPLAQALYKGVEVGQEVPPEFYQAIAEILAYVYELAGRGRRLRKAG